ncbi:MAG: hypothetical protein EA397_06315 [Deltaproteobacteria bacterium]|nr:MAG: hypothetical protein EA397_06315 [Deltaproteobacteria bacterium]
MPIAPPKSIPLRLVGVAVLGILPALALTPSLLAQGGLAILAACSVVAVAVGLPLVSAERSVEAVDSRLRVGAEDLGSLLLTLAIAAAAAPWVALLGWPGIAIMAVGWSAASWPSRASWIGIVVLLALGATGVVVSLGMGPVQDPGWTLLRPWWSSWASWIGLTLIGGMLLAGVGYGGPKLLPGPRWRSAAACVAVGLFFALGLSLLHATSYELDLSLQPSTLTIVAVLPLLGAAPLMIATRTELPRLHAAIGLALSLLLAGPGLEGLPFFWGALLPAGLAICLILKVLIAQGVHRFVLGLGALLSLAVIPLTAPSLPGTWAAAVLALVPGLAVWLVGTRQLLVQRHA